MNRKTGATIAIGILLTLTCVAAVLGQGPSGPTKPGPEHQKLAYFAGKWASEGETKPSAFGPGGKFTFTQTCEWFAGSGFALLPETGSARSDRLLRDIRRAGRGQFREMSGDGRGAVRPRFEL